MTKTPPHLLKDTLLNQTQCRGPAWMFRSYLLMLLLCALPDLPLCASVAGSKVEHEGLCPNKLNSNLWVDAQSTCERECSVDEVTCGIRVRLD